MSVEIDFKELRSLKLTAAEYIYVKLLVTDPKLADQFKQYSRGVTPDELDRLVTLGYISMDYSIPMPIMINHFRVNDDNFLEFYEKYPATSIRPGGKKVSLRLNVAKCRLLYKKYIGSNDELHKDVLKCLDYEVESARKGCFEYFKTMENWLSGKSWEAYIDIVKEHDITKDRMRGGYGNDIL